jgi:hypothetical protein
MRAKTNRKVLGKVMDQVLRWASFNPSCPIAGVILFW